MALLTKRQNMLETIRGGTPDRFVNQFEALEFIWGTPYSKRNMGGGLRPGRRNCQRVGRHHPVSGEYAGAVSRT